MKLLAPSILSADLSNLAQQIRMAEIGGADWIHCDIMDGHFVRILLLVLLWLKPQENVLSFRLMFT